MKKIKDLILRHKILSIICLIAFVIIIILAYMFCSIFVGGNNKYGNRLDGIKEVELTNTELKELANDLETEEEVDSAKVRLQGKIVYFDIIFTEATSKDKATEIASKTLENFSEEEQNYYDFEYILTQVGNEEEDYDGFRLTGTKSPKIEKINWIKN